MRPGNTGRIAITTALAASLWAATARAQVVPAAPPAIAQPGLDPAPPPAAAALEMFNSVADWVKRWQTPMDPMGQPPVHAAAVTLRYEGSIVGRGVAISPDPAGSPGIVMMAASRAMNEAKTRLPVPRDALMEESLRALAPMIAITVEIAGRPVPIAPKEWANAVEEIGPGLDGVAVRMGERIEAMFPETMLVTGTDAAGAFRALVSKVSGDPTLGLKKPGELREKEGVEFYRLKVVQVGQVQADQAPVLLHRGCRLYRVSELTEPAIRHWAERLAENLWNRRSTERPHIGLRGMYDPVRGTWEPAASPLDQIVVADAMYRYSAVMWGDGVSNERQHSIDAWVLDLLRDMAVVEAGEQEPWSDSATAVLCWCLLERAGVKPIEHSYAGTMREIDEPGLMELKRRCREAWLPLMEGIDNAATELRPLLLWGLVRASSGATRCGGLVGRQLAMVPPGRLVATMPWLGWAATYPGVGLDAAQGLRQMRSQLWEFQIKPESLDAARMDLAGAIAFTTTGESIPTWQSARPLAFVASMLRDPRVTEDGEINAELARLLGSLRFLRQLTADQTTCRMYKDPAKAIGGVRNSLFDQRMPPEATAMTLLTVCETLKSLDAIKARQAASKNGGPEPPGATPKPAPK